MKSNLCRIVLGLALMGPMFAGCVRVHNRQVFFKERSGTPVRVDAREGVRVRAPFVDVVVPSRKSPKAVVIEGSAVEPD